MSNKNCPGCGAPLPSGAFNRLGWYYADCGMRYHRGRQEWEPMPPIGCLRRQVAQLQAENARLRAIEQRVREAELLVDEIDFRQTVNLTMCQGGMSVGPHDVGDAEDVWWPAVKAVLLGEQEGKDSHNDYSSE